MQQNRLQYLLDRYGVNQASAAEITELEEYLATSANSDAFEQAGFDLMQQAAAGKQASPDGDAYHQLLQNILAVDQPAPATPARLAKGRFRWMAAAAAVLVLATAIVLWLSSNNKPAQPEVVAQEQQKDIDPGKEGAVLTLADGTRVVLDSAGNGIIARQNGASVVLKNGSVQYDVTKESASETAFNTMSTPKGRQFQLTLPDGSKVWLNSASSIRFPTLFKGNERMVTITGEVYFEVTKQPSMPFRVNVNNKATIEVLGTHFNVNAYDNELDIKTTLLEGSVKIGHTTGTDKNTATLAPGQQAQLNAQQIKVIKSADINKVMAWKNGLFNFDGSSLEEVMKQLERWYDIEVVYEEGIPAIQFFGKMSKDMTLSQLLDALKTFDVHFTIEGKKLIIQK